MDPTHGVKPRAAAAARASTPWLSRDVLAWTLYDVASSVWIATIPTILFAVYFRSVVAADGRQADALWGLTAAAALVIAGLAAPWVGARADARGSRLRWLGLATALCCAATAAMAFVRPGDILLAALVFIAAQAGYTVAMALYDAYLTRVAGVGNAGRVSALGWSAGFLGGAVALAVCIVLLQGVEVAHDPRYTVAFVVVAFMMTLAAVPALLGLRRLRAVPVAPAATARSSGGAVLATLRGWRAHRNALRFLIALYLINDALATVAFFAGIYFREQFGVSLVGLLQLALLYQVLAIPFTLAFGRFADRTSPHFAVYCSLAVWTAAVLLMAFGSGPLVPVIVVALLAAALGSTQALMRGMYALLVPPAQAGQFFGFNALAGRLSAATGPLLYGVVSVATGSPRVALLSLLVFLIAGALVLAGVRIERLDPAEPAPEPAR